MGRKKLKTETKVEKVDIRLRVDPGFAAQLQALADAEGNSVAALIRATMSQELKRRARENDE